MALERNFLGIDGGGTKTTAVVCNEKGKIISVVVGDSINYCSVGMDRARGNMKKIIDIIEEKTGIDRFFSAFIGMSALFSRATEDETKVFADGVIDADFIAMDTDLYIGLEAMMCDGACAVAISGTGSMAVARTDNDEIIHTGGWGFILGDEGSGYAIALDALRAGVCSFENSGRKTLIEKKMIDFYGVNSMYELVDIFYDPPKERNEIAKFVPAFFECVNENDSVAVEIAKKNAKSFADTVTALLRQLPKGINLGLWGGVFTNNPVYSELFKKYINDFDDKCRIEILQSPPEVGALAAAIKNCGISFDKKLLKDLTKNYKMRG